MGSTARNPAEQSATRGPCLTCAVILDLLPGGAVPDHQNDGTPCTGARFRSAQNDGRDDTRREAIRQWHALKALSVVKRTDFATNLGKSGWRMRDLLSMDARAVVMEEAQAEHWRDLAMHGDWWETTRRAVALLARRPLTTDDVDRGLEGWEQAGARHWLRAAQPGLQAELRETTGWPATALSNLLFML